MLDEENQEAMQDPCTNILHINESKNQHIQILQGVIATKNLGAAHPEPVASHQAIPVLVRVDAVVSQVPVSELHWNAWSGGG